MPIEPEDKILDQKLKKLEQRLAQLPPFAVAFSGGVDSVFLTAVACNTVRYKVVAVTVACQFVPASEVEAAKQMADRLGVEHRCLEMDILSDENVVRNDPQRCYFCKKQIFSAISDAAGDIGVNTLLHGVNLDDLGDYRPGLKAAQELGFISPLADAGFTKSDIRELSRQMGLETWDKPSQSCLATRIPYHDTITVEDLIRIDTAEKVLHELGFAQVRVRVHGRTARVEVEPDLIERVLEPGLRIRISRAFKDIGFEHTGIDIDGYRSGKMNNEILGS